VNKETLKNAYQRFQEEGMVQVVKSKDPKVPPRLRLAPGWNPPRDEKTGRVVALGSRLWQFIARIAASRRGGKNRRDGATVSTRVVELADLVGGRLFEEALTAADAKGGAPVKLTTEEKASVEKSVREERRRRTLGNENKARL